MSSISTLRPVELIHKKPEDEEWLKAKLTFEDQLCNQINFENDPEKWHEKILALRRVLVAEAKKQLKKLHAQDIYKANRSKLPNGAWEPLPFEYFGLENALLVDKGVSSPLRVSIATYERALAIANTLLFAAETRGFKVEIKLPKGRIYVRAGDANIGFAIRERQQSKGSELRLALIADEGAQFSIEDRGDVRLEERLGEFFLRLYPAIVKGWEKARKDAEDARIRSANWAAYEEITRQRAIESEHKALDTQRRAELLLEVGQWEKAQQIRAYVCHVDSKSVSNSQSVSAWIDWALKVAEDIDPTTSRVTD